MSAVEKARDTQLRNVSAKIGMDLAEVRGLIAKSGLAKHGEIRAHLMKKLGLGHGDANTLVHFALASDGLGAALAAGISPSQVLDTIYAGRKAHLRPVHDALMTAIEAFGEFEIAPRKGYVSLRRRKQFATIGPATQDRIDVGLNMRDVPATARLAALPPGGMCQYKVRVTGVEEVDRELVSWIRRAYDSAG